MTTPATAAIDFVARHARSRPQQLACRDLDLGTAYTYAELDQSVSRLAVRLQGAVGHGDRVALLSRNRTDAIALQWACVRLGALFVPMNWRLSPTELAQVTADCSPSLIVHEDEFADAALACGVTALSLDDPRPLGVVSESQGQFSSQEVATLLYTSGTTGRPKGVIFTEANAQCAAQNFISVAQIGPGSILLCDAPIFHTIGLYALSRSAIQAGAAVLFSSRFNPAVTYQRLIDPDLGVSHYMAAPQMAEAMRGVAGFEGGKLAHLTGIFTGGAPYPAQMVKAWTSDGVRLAHGYGMSECGTALCMPLDLDKIRDKAESAGLIAPDIEIRLSDPEGGEVATGEIGEIWLRGPSVSPGYWNNPSATVASRDHDWLKSGDVAWRDAEGYYYVCDRLKDMYISGGENVFPAEVEAVLLAHEEVAEAAVVGVKDPQWGEVGWAFIVGSASDSELAAHCRSRLAGYKLPKRFVRLDALPRTMSGKIQKHLLRESLKDMT